MKNIWEEDLTVRASEIDMFNRVKLSSVFNYVQNIASDHAEHLKVGYKDLYPKKLFWVLSWIKLEFNSFPQLEENIHAVTWPKGLHKLFALRDILISGSDENVFCRAATAWLMVNAQTRRLVNPKEYLTHITTSPEKQALSDLPRKMNFAIDYEFAFKRKINFSDVDLNMHVNNAKYTDFIVDCYPAEFHQKNLLLSIELSFISEAKYGDEIGIRLSKDGETNETHQLVCVNIKENKIVLTAEIKWKRIDFV